MSTTWVPPASGANRALPYVTGISRRIKAEPTKLSPLAVNIMAASGSLRGQRSGANPRLVRTITLLAVFAIAAMFLWDGSFGR